MKDVMLPLLVGVFEAKFALQQSKARSRLHLPPKEAPEKIRKQLEELQEDIDLLLLWCQGCKTQIHKALEETKDKERAPLHNVSAQAECRPDVSKSFSGAMSYQVPKQEEPPPSLLARGTGFVLHFIQKIKDNLPS